VEHLRIFFKDTFDYPTIPTKTAPNQQLRHYQIGIFYQNDYIIEPHFFLAALVKHRHRQPNISAIWYNTSSGGCISLVHQRDTVDLSLPTCSASQMAVLSFSARTTLIRLNFLIVYYAALLKPKEPSTSE
jgi:hypothetical protein